MNNHLSSLRSRLMLLVSAIILALFAHMVILEALWLRSRYQLGTQGSLEVAQAIGLAFRGFVRDVLRQENAIGNAVLTFAPANPDSMREYLRLVEEPYNSVRIFSLVDSSGTIVSSSRSQSIGLSLADREYFARLKAGDTTVISDYLRTKTENIAGFIVGRGFFDPSGRLRFAVLGVVEADLLGEITLRLKRQPGQYMTLFDRQGVLVYTNQGSEFFADTNRSWREKDPLLRKALNGEPSAGLIAVPVTRDSRRIGARVPIEELGWVAGSAVTRARFFRPHLISFALVLVISIAVAGLTLLLARRTVNVISGSLQAVQRHVRKIAEGEFVTSRTVSGLSEFDSLIDDANTMAQRLKDREERLRLMAAVVENSSDFIGLASPGMTPFYINDAGRRMVGLEATADIAQTRIMDFFPPEDRHLIETVVLPALQRDERWVGEVRFSNFKTGKPVHTLWNIFAIRDGTGRLLAWASICPDLTQVKQAAEELRRSEQRFRTLADSMPQLVWTANPDGTVDYYNERYRNFGGISPEPDGTWRWGQVVHAQDLRRTVDAWNHSVKTGDTYQIEHRAKHADGTFHWYLSRGIPVRDAHGQIVKWYGTATNIDFSKQAQMALEEGEKRLRTLNEDLETIVVARTEQVRSLSKALTVAEQRERKRFSYVLHENLQQLLLGAKMLLGQHIREHGTTPQPGEFDDVAETLRLLEKALGTTRSLSIELNPPVLRTQGLDAALEWLADHMQKNYGLEVELHLQGAIGAIRDETQLMLTQMVRELLSNVLQHSGVLRARVEAACEHHRIRIEVLDAGRGFDPSQVFREKVIESRLGLFSIRERLKLFGGDLTISSAVGRGTQCVILLPFDNC